MALTLPAFFLSPLQSNFNSMTNDVATVPDFQILDNQPSKRADEDAQIHHLLDNAMYDPRRRQTIHKRSQLDDDIRFDIANRATRSPNVTFHHQNPFLLPHLIDKSSSKQKSHRARSASTPNKNKNANVARNASNDSRRGQRPSISSSTSNNSSVASPTSKILDYKTKSARHSSQEDERRSSACDFAIPPPWKTMTVDVRCINMN